MTKDKIKKAIDAIGLPRLIVFCFFMAIVITAAVNDIDVASYFSSTLKYFGMWGILVLAMLPSIKCGIGPNFGVSLGIVCGLLGTLLAIQFNIAPAVEGILPGFGGTQRLARLVGKGRAKELIFTCDYISADEAYRIGLANKVVPQEELMDTCIAMAEKILTKGSYAISLAKMCIETGMDTDLDSGLDMEATNFGLSFATADKKEGMTAFLEKRPANLTDF